MATLAWIKLCMAQSIRVPFAAEQTLVQPFLHVDLDN